MIFKAFRALLTLVPAGYIGPADAAGGGDLTLGAGNLPVQTVAEGDDLRLPLGQTAVHAAADLGAGVLGIQILQHVVVHADDVHQGEGVAVPVGVDGVGQGHIPLVFPLASEVHENLVLHAPAGIGCQPDVFIRLEGGNPLDEPDGPNGDEIILVAGLDVILFQNVGHQAQIVLDELVAGLQVALGKPL